MGEISFWQASFNGGEQTPLLEGREDTQKYQTGCRRLRNMHGIIQGPARRRTGSRRVANTKNNGEAWLIPFIKSRQDKYVIELGNNYARFYKDRGQLFNTSTGSGVDDSFTKALLHMDGADASTTFTDESGKVWTAAGNAQIDTAQKKFGSASGLFDGTGDWLTTPDHADFALGSGDFTVDLWFNCTKVGGVDADLGGQTDGIGTPWANTSFFIDRGATNVMRFFVSDGTNLTAIQGTTQFTDLINPGWHHLAAVRSGNTLRLFIDGIQEASTTFAAALPNATALPTIGVRASTGGSPWQGWIDEWRFSKGVARWTENFVPPEAYGTPYEIATPWTYADLTDTDGTFKFRLVQNQDVIYVCGGTGIKQINRFSDLNWTITDFDSVGGPFDAVNVSATTVYASAATGSVALTASSAIFTSGHVGSLMLLRPQDLSAVPPWEVHQGVATDALRQNDGKTYKMVTAGVTVANGQPVTGTKSPIHEQGVEKDGSPDSKTLDPFDNTGQVQAGLDWEFQDPGYGIVKITAVGSGTSATATVQPWRIGAVARLPAEVVGSGNASDRWAFGLWSNANGWPKAVTFFRERLVFGMPRQLAFSVPQGFTEFLQETAGQVLADNGFVADISSDRDEELRWLLPNGAVMHVGTTGGELACLEQNPNNAFGPLNRKIDPQTGSGSNGVVPLRVGDTPLFVEASGLRVRKIVAGDSGSFQALSQNDLADHITNSTVIQATYAALPDSFYWGLRADGRLCCLTFSPEQDVFGWSLHFIGGYRDASRLQPAKGRAMTSIPSADGEIDDVWLIVERYINGQTVRWIEFFTEQTKKPERWEYESADAYERRVHSYQSTLYFTDGGTVYDDPRTITNVTVSLGVATVTTSGNHGYLDGALVRLDDLVGPWPLNARAFQIDNSTPTTFELVDFDASSLPAYVMGGQAREMVSVISNLGPWEGQTLQVLTDGAVHPDRTVSGGQITLQYPAARVVVGFGYKSLVETQRPAGGNSKGSAQGQLGAINELIVRLEASLGGLVGPDEDHLQEILYRSAVDEMDLPPPLFSGDKEISWPDGFSTDRTVVFVQDQPLPSIIKGFGLDMEVSES